MDFSLLVLPREGTFPGSIMPGTRMLGLSTPRITDTPVSLTETLADILEDILDPVISSGTYWTQICASNGYQMDYYWDFVSGIFCLLFFERIQVLRPLF